MLSGLRYQKVHNLNNIRGKCSLSICYSLRIMDCPLSPHSSPQIHFPDGETESQLACGHGAAMQLAWSQWLNSSLLFSFAVCSEDSYCRGPAPSTTRATFLMLDTGQRPTGSLSSHQLSAGSQKAQPILRTCEIPCWESCCSPRPLPWNTVFIAHYSVLIERLTFLF